MVTKSKIYTAAFIFIALTSCGRTSDSPLAKDKEICPSTIQSSVASFGARSSDSSIRYANENWETLASFDASTSVVPSTSTPRAQAIPFAQGYDFKFITEWAGSMEDLEEAFAEARDSRRYEDDAHEIFPRRATWLYPYDGCASRAAHMSHRLRERGLSKPTKLFAFGNLKAKTRFQRGGTVFWWYHTAPAYRLGDTTWVLDPSVESKAPLTLAEWLSRMSSKPETIKLAVCDGNAFNAQSICRGGNDDQDRDFEGNIRSYLPLEWRNVETLSYDPEKLLGDEPPWVVDPTPIATSPTKINEARCAPSAGTASPP